MNAKHVNIIFARYVITVIYTRLYALLYFLLRRFRVTVVSCAERKRYARRARSFLFVCFLVQSGIEQDLTAAGFTRRAKPPRRADRYELRESLKEHRVYRLKYLVSYISCPTAKQATSGPLVLAVRANVSAAPQRRSRSTWKETYISITCLRRGKAQPARRAPPRQPLGYV